MNLPFLAGMLGQLKELLQIALALALFRDELHPINVLGIILSLLASAGYKMIKSSESPSIASGTATYTLLNQVQSTVGWLVG